MIRRHTATAVVVLALVLAACAPSASGSPAASPAAPSASPSAGILPGVHPVAAQVLAEHGHAPTGPTTVMEMEIGDLQEQPWSLYLEVSRAVGLDFGTLEGRSAELLRTPVAGGAPDAAVFLLRVEDRLVGAWLAPGGSSSGVLPISERL